VLQGHNNACGTGGGGEIYRGQELDDHRDPCRDVAIKVSTQPLSWHGEAYFGRLLAEHPHVVRLLHAFPIVDGAGAARLAKYILVLDWMREGTVYDLLSRENQQWPEDIIVNQTAALLRVLALLHHRGICHGDITPRNVFIADRRLLLGDLGIAKQTLTEGPIEMDGATPGGFAPLDAFPFYWSPSADVYQVGLLALSLLAGEVITSYEVCGRVLKSVTASDHVKGWIRDAVSKEDERFEDAVEALAALLSQPVKPARAPRSLKGQRVVFTGILPITRPIAQQRAKQAGAIVQHRVNGATTLIIAGQPNPLQIGQRAGTKLFDAHRRMRHNQRIAIIDAKRFEHLLDRS
jgi:serine/threonine protein kinase